MVSPGLLVIGDSQLKYGHLYTNLFPGYDVTIISQSGMRIEEVNGPKLMATKFFNDVIHLGTNNLICGQSPEQVTLQYEALVKQILKGNPQIRLFVSSVLFRSTNRFKPYSRTEVSRVEKINGSTKKLNKLLEGLATRYGIYYLENWEAFSLASSDPCSELLSCDGLHLTPQGVQCLLDITGRILFPEEVSTFLSFVYSLIPPIRVGKDSRFGIGFRVGPNIDAQVLVELGPQQNTQPLGPSNNTRRQVRPIDMERIAEILKPFNITKLRSPQYLQNNNNN